MVFDSLHFRLERSRRLGQCGCLFRILRTGEIYLPAQLHRSLQQFLHGSFSPFDFVDGTFHIRAQTFTHHLTSTYGPDCPF
jgi:hypothetical protein